MQKRRRDQAIKRAADLRSQAFVTEGEHRYELELQTIVTQREADATTSEIDKLDLQITVRSSEMVMVEQQWTLSTSAIEAVKRQIDDAETRHNKVEELRQAAVQFVERFRLAIHLHAFSARRFVDQIDCFVGQEAITNIAVR